MTGVLHTARINAIEVIVRNVKVKINQHDTSEGQRKILSPDRNGTHDLSNTGRALYPESEVI